MLGLLAALEETLNDLCQYPHPDVDVTPILLTSHPTQRAQQKTRLEALSDDFGAACATITRLEAQLQQLKQSMLYRHAAVTNALSPVGSLPTELLRDIFMLAVDNGADDSLQTRLAVSQACQYWRAVSLALPEFWQSLVLNATQAHLYETLRLRSYPLGMWLRVEDPPRPMRDGLLGKPDHEESSDLLSEPMTNSFAPPQESRLVSLRIEDGARFPFAQFFGDSVLPVTLDEVQVLASSHQNQHYNCAAMFLPRKVSARSLMFNRAWIDPLHFEVNILSKLRLVDVPHEAMGRLLSVAADCPNLEILHLESIRRKEPTPTSPVLLLSPWLSLSVRHLAMIDCEEELWMHLLSVPTFRLPKLVAFIFQNSEEFAAVWGPTSQVFRAFLLASPYLAHLNIATRALDLPHVVLSLLAQDNTLPAPMLSSLEIISLSPASQSSLSRSVPIQMIPAPHPPNEENQNEPEQAVPDDLDGQDANENEGEDFAPPVDNTPLEPEPLENVNGGIPIMQIPDDDDQDPLFITSSCIQSVVRERIVSTANSAEGALNELVISRSLLAGGRGMGMEEWYRGHLARFSVVEDLDMSGEGW